MDSRARRATLKIGSRRLPPRGRHFPGLRLRRRGTGTRTRAVLPGMIPSAVAQAPGWTRRSLSWSTPAWPVVFLRS